MSVDPLFLFCFFLYIYLFILFILEPFPPPLESTPWRTRVDDSSLKGRGDRASWKISCMKRVAEQLTVAMVLVGMATSWVGNRRAGPWLAERVWTDGGETKKKQREKVRRRGCGYREKKTFTERAENREKEAQGGTGELARVVQVWFQHFLGFSHFIMIQSWFLFFFLLLSSFVDWSGCHRPFVSFARPLPDHAWPHSTSIPCVWPLAYTTNWPKPHLLFSIAPKLINPSTLHACDHLAWEWRTPLPFAAKPFLYPHLCPLLICSLPSTPSSLIPTIYPSPTTNLPYPSHRCQTHFLSLGFLHPVVNPSTKLLPRWPPKPPPTRPPAPPPSVADDASVQAAIVGTRHLQRRSTASSWE